MCSLDVYTLNVEFSSLGYCIFLWSDFQTKGMGRSRFYWLALWKAHKDLKKNLLAVRNF